MKELLLRKETLFKNCSLRKWLWILWIPFRITLVMKDSLPSFVTEQYVWMWTLMLFPGLLPRRMQLKRRIGSRSLCGCWMCCWLLGQDFISLCFGLLICKANIFSIAEGICKTRRCPWSALRSPTFQNHLTPLEWIECCYSNSRSCWPWLLDMTEPPFFVAVKIDALETVHSLLPFRQIPFYSESLLQVKWSNCKRFPSIR